MTRSWLLLLAGLGIFGCNNKEPREAPSEGATSRTEVSSASSVLPAPAESEKPDADAPVDEKAFAGAKPIAVKSIGHTSVVLKIDFSNGRRAAYKPSSKRGKTRYKGEIAAYRLARALGLSNVPPAFFVPLREADLTAAAQGKDAALIGDEAIADGDGTVRGALIPWIPKLEFAAIETAKERARWEPWLFDGSSEIPEADRSTAGDISTLIAFDVLTGNWDRWSGGNVGAGPAGHLLYIDNDGAFFDPVPPGPLAKEIALLQRTERFSRSFVEALRKLDADALAHAMGEESPGQPLLSASVLKGVAARRNTVLAAIDKKIAARGEAAVLFFP